LSYVTMSSNIALTAALRLSRRLKSTAAKYDGLCRDEVSYGATGDATYEVDEPVEAAVVDFFTDLKLPCRVMTEDKGVIDYGKDPEYIFLIDPLDGSRNARRGLPLYCSSVAVYDFSANELSQAKYAVVERFDAKEEFVAVEGEGATLNGRRIKASHKTSMDDAIISMGCHFASSLPSFAQAGRKLGALASRAEREMMVKCYGSTALELAYLACGKTDMLYDIRAETGFSLSPKTYDIAAGVLLCRQAGAVVEYGGERIPQRLRIDPSIRVQIWAAGNASLFNTLVSTLR
jgi:myo-inositol-1(or 4)-monophosphatase